MIMFSFGRQESRYMKNGDIKECTSSLGHRKTGLRVAKFCEINFWHEDRPHASTMHGTELFDPNFIFAPYLLPFCITHIQSWWCHAIAEAWGTYKLKRGLNLKCHVNPLFLSSCSWSRPYISGALAKIQWTSIALEWSNPRDTFSRQELYIWLNINCELPAWTRGGGMCILYVTTSPMSW